MLEQRQLLSAAPAALLSLDHGVGFSLAYVTARGGKSATHGHGRSRTAAAPTTTSQPTSDLTFTPFDDPTFSDADIGSPAVAGSASYSSGTYTVSGAGTDIWGTSDQFNFASQSFTGDGSIVAEINSQTNTNSAAKAGVMIRNDSTAGSAYAAAFVTPGQGVDFQWRSAAGGNTSDTLISGVTAPVWLKLTRSGDSFTAYYSTDGSTWTQIGSAETAAVSSNALAGLAVGSKNTATLSTATFTNLSFAAAPALPSGWSDGDIGSPADVGGATFDGTIWTVAGGGTDIWSTADQFNFASQSLTGDGSIVAEVNSQTNTNSGAKAGVMIRNDSTAGSAYAAAFITPSQGVDFQWRSAAGGTTADTLISGVTAPVWLKLARSGDSFTAYYSADGSTWTQIGTGRTVTVSSNALAGLAVGSKNTATLSTATFTNLSLAAAPALPSGWTDGDIGSPADVGGATFDGTTWTIAGGGTDIWSTADQFNFASQSFTGDGSIVAEVTSQTNTNSAAKAGVMIRSDTTAGSANAAAFVTPGVGVDFQWRGTAGGATTDTLISGITAPVWVKLTRIGQSFAAYYSTDGSTWTQIGSVETANVASSALAGLAVGAKNAATLSTATFTNLSLTAAPPLPSGWSDADIGSATPPGYAGYDGTTVTIASTGVIGPNTFNSMYIGGTTDSFNTVYQPLGSNQQFVAEITSQEDVSALAKAGIMLRASTDPSDVFAGLFVTPGWGVAMLDRTASGADATSSGFDNSYSLKNGPLWVKLTTSGGIVTGFVSADGTNWSQIGQVTIDLGSSPLAGLAVDGGDGQSRGTASFTNFSLGTITTSTTIPEAPYDTYAEAYSGTDGRLVWEPTSGVDTFTIEQSTNGGNTYTTVATVPGTADTYLPNDLSPDTTYTYRVQATTGGVNSLNSATASLTTTANDTAGNYFLVAGTPQVLYNYFGDTMAVTLAATTTSASSWQQAYFLDASGSVSSPGIGLSYTVGNFSATTSGTGFYGNSFGLVGTSQSGMGFDADAGMLASYYPQIDVVTPVLQASITASIQGDTADPAIPSPDEEDANTAPANFISVPSGSGTLNFTATGLAGLDPGILSELAWTIQPSPAGQPQSVLDLSPSTPTFTMGTMGTTATSISMSGLGSFNVICYLDKNGNGQYDSGEQVGIFHLAEVGLYVQSLQTFRNNGSFTTYTIEDNPVNQATIGGKIVAGDLSGNNFGMTETANVWLLGGGSGGLVGLGEMHTGFLQNMTSDTYKVTYDDNGTESEVLGNGATFPILDSSYAPKGGDSTLVLPDAPQDPSLIANAPPAGSSRDTITGSDPSGGQDRAVTGADSPAASVPGTDSTGGNATYAAGSNNFQDALVAYSDKFPNWYGAYYNFTWSVNFAYTYNNGQLTEQGSTGITDSLQNQGDVVFGPSQPATTPSALNMVTSGPVATQNTHFSPVLPPPFGA